MKTVWERFCDKFDISEESGCWIWNGAISRSTGIKRGPRSRSRKDLWYGYFRYEGRNQVAHRVSYQIIKGPIPKGMVLDHTCANGLCVNPAHLEPLTNGENVQRGYDAKAPLSHCINGHKFTELTTAWKTKHGGRQYRECRTCMREQQARIRAKRKAHRF